MTHPFADLPARANADANVQRLGRTFTGAFTLAIDDLPVRVAIENGVVQAAEAGPFKMRASSFRIAATAETWAAFQTPRPRPGYHDIFAMTAAGVAEIDGDVNVLLEHLAFFKALLASLREEE